MTPIDALLVLLAADIPGLPVSTEGMTTLEKLLLVALVGSLSVIYYLFSKLDALRERAYADIKADAAVDRDLAAAVKTLLERTEKKP